MNTVADNPGYVVTDDEAGTRRGPRLGAWFLVAVVAAVTLTFVDTSPSAGTYHLGDSSDSGYWMIGLDGTVTEFSVGFFGDVVTLTGAAAPSPVVSMAATPSGLGYMVLSADGRMYFFGDAPNRGSVQGSLNSGEVAASVSVTPSGQGYWVFTTVGRVIAFGDATHRGDVSTLALAGPIVSSVPTPSGLGYYMLGSDGGVFAFGDAMFRGSIPLVLPNTKLACDVVGLVPTSSGNGYWLVACDGGVFAFGDAEFVGSIPGVLPPGTVLAAPINGMVAYGNGYLMVAFDGGVFNFATDLLFLGSLGDKVLPAPIVGVVPRSS